MADYSGVWQKLHSFVINQEDRDILYLLIHNKLSIPERLHRIKVRRNPYCLSCPNTVCDVVHYFCLCCKTERCWSWLKLKIFHYCPSQISDWDLLNLFIPNTPFLKEILWMIGIYVSYAWRAIEKGNKGLCVEKFFGFLSFKYKEDINLLSDRFNI